MWVFETVIAAFAMFSSIPMPRAGWSQRTMRYLMGAFPLVGVVCGGLFAAWTWLAGRLGLGPALTGAVCTLLPVWVSGGIHLDGFCDTVDALSSHAPRERKLEILKDSHAGAFAVIGTCCWFLLYFALCAELRWTRAEALCAGAGFVLSRALSGLCVTCLPSARGDGLVRTFSDGAEKRGVRVLLALEALLAALFMVWASPALALGSVGASLLALGVGIWVMQRRFGGVTGDLAGYFLSLCEVMQLAGLLVAGRLAG